MAPTVSPTTAATSQPTTLQEGILSALSNAGFDEFALLDMPLSPQQRAYDFLLETTRFNVHSPQRIVQRFSMAVFYFATNGPAWERNAQWLNNIDDDDDECLWYNYDGTNPCNAQGELVYLMLPRNNLMGELPNELGLLTSLREIYLGGNDLVGKIPASLGNLGNLVHLDLSWTDVDGPIPSTLGRLTLLQRISLVGTLVSGPVPAEIGNLVNLDELLLAKTKLSGAMPASVCALDLNEMWADCDAVPCPCCNYCCSNKQGIETCRYV